MDCFDADVLIYAAVDGHVLGTRVRNLFQLREGTDELVGIGSVLLLPELLTKPMRTKNGNELEALAPLISRIELLPVDQATARLAVALGAKYGLRTADAIHLATGVKAGADRFITNNSKHFTPAISEISVTYPSTDL